MGVSSLVSQLPQVRVLDTRLQAYDTSRTNTDNLRDNALSRVGDERVSLTITYNQRSTVLMVQPNTAIVEIIPQAARRLGVFDPTVSFAGYRLLTREGTTLDDSSTLAQQHIDTHTVLTLQPRALSDEHMIYDDVVEAIGHAQQVNTPWTAQDTARTALIISMSLFLISALCLFTLRSSLLLTGISFSFCTIVYASALIFLSHSMRYQSIIAALIGSIFAALSGYHTACLLTANIPTVTEQSAISMMEAAHENITYYYGYPLLGVGIALVAYSVLCAITIRYKQIYHTIPLILGSTIIVSSALTVIPYNDASTVWLIGTALIALLANTLPWICVSIARISVHSPQREADIFAPPDDIHYDELQQRYQWGSTLLFCLRCATAIFVLLVIPQAAALPHTYGILLCLAIYLAMMLDTRHIPTLRDMIIVIGAASIGIIGISINTVLTHPNLQAIVAGMLLLSAFATIVTTQLSPRLSLLRERIADIAETCCIVAIAPLAYAAIITR